MNRRSTAAILVLLLFAACGDGEPAASEGGGRPGGATGGSGGKIPVPEGTGFVDRAAYAGITAENHTGKAERKDFIVEAKGGGAIVIDYDGDGDVDLYIVDGNTYQVDGEGNVVDRSTHPDAMNRLYRNHGGWRFTDVTAEAGVGDRSFGFGGTVGDYDNDGDPDMFVCNWGTNILYRNNGDGTFTDVTAEAGVGGDDAYYSTCATFFDADGDGDLDLYVSNYNRIGDYIREQKGRGRTAHWRGIPVYAGPAGIAPAADLFYVNNGDGTFTDVSATALVDQEARFGFTSVVGDFDRDGDLDLYVANDTHRNFLWVNDGKGIFTDGADRAACAVNRQTIEQAGMGLDSADYDQDGWPDLFVTNFAFDQNTLYRNRTGRQGRLMFEDVTERVGLAQRDFLKVCWGTKFQDLNHDGYLDIFVAAGHVYEQVDLFQDAAGITYAQLPSLYYNLGPKGDYRFRDVTEEVGGPGLAIRKVGRAVCFADFDNDGDVDLYISGLNQRPLLLENRLPKAGKGNWIMLGLSGKADNRDAIGTRVTVVTPEFRQMQEMRVAASFIGTNDPRLHWGLGDAETLTIEVEWFGGGKQTFTEVPANRHYRLSEGGELR
jgi:hypothetical protein